MQRRKTSTSTNVLLQLSITNAWVSQLFDQELVRLGIEPAQCGVLTLIGQYEPVTPTVLEQQIGLPGATLRERVNSLVAAGYVERVPNEQDGRSYFLRVTDSGNDLIATSADALRTVEEALESATGRKLADMHEFIEDVGRAARDLMKGAPAEGEGSKTVGPW